MNVPVKSKFYRHLVLYLVGFFLLFTIINAWVQNQGVQSIGITSQWLPVGLVITAAIATIWIWVKSIYSGIRSRQIQQVTRSGTVLLSFILWFALLNLQRWMMFSIPTNDFVYSMFFGLGYFVLPFCFYVLWRFVLMHIKRYLWVILKMKRYRLLFIFSIVTYVLFYLFSSGLVASPDPRQPLPANGYFRISQLFGLLSYWPSVEFWWPAVNLTGTVSLSTLMLIFTLAGFVGIIIVFLVFNLMATSQKKSLKTIGGTTGSSAGAIIAGSFGCCSLLYPLLLIPLFGSTAVESLSFFLTDPSGLPYNVLQMGILSVMAVTVVSASRRVGDDCQVDKHHA
jgi:hypothetical protein